MPLAEALLLKLAPTVTGALSKLLFGESAFAEQIFGAATDAATEAGLSRRQRNQLDRELAAVGERVVERLEPFVRVEHASEADLEAAVAEASQTLRGGFNAVDLALGADLNADALEMKVRSRRPSAARDAGLDAVATQAYDLIIRESCAYVVQMARELPDFPQRALVELLQRSSALEDLLINALDALPNAASSAALDFETRYRRAVTAALDSVSLLGLRVSNRAAERYSLSVAYVSLGATSGTAPDDTLGRRLGAAEPSWIEETNRIEELVARNRHLLISGVAGSGKTTVLQWLSVRAAKGEALSRTGGEPDVPIYIRLRDYAKEALPMLDQAVDGMAGPAAGIRPADWLISRLEAGRVLLLVDGLDELPLSRRDDVSLWMDRLLQQFPRLRLVATSRPAALSGWAAPEGLALAHLEPMMLPDIDRFIDHWHDAAGLGADDRQRRDLKSKAEQLKRTLRLQGSIRRLVTNPLMCAVTCALHQEGGGTLPSSRVELYLAALDLLLDARERRRGIATHGFDLSRAQKVLVLEELAWWMIRNGATAVPASDAVRRLEPLTERLGVDADADGVLNYLVERTGVLREPIVGHIDFVHKTFMEFLGATKALQEGDLGLLVRSATDPAFHEVVVLAAGTASAKDRETLVRGLLDRANDVKRGSAALRVLAAQCVDVSPEADPKLRRRVAIALDRHIPPTDLTTADDLATAGDVAVPLLPNEGLTAEEARASVRALARIGTVAALEQLRGYGTDSRAAVVRELVAGWDAFDRAAYAREVMAESPLIDGALAVDGVSDLEFLTSLRHLVELKLVERTALDWSAIARIAALERAQLSHATGLRSLRPFAGAGRLDSLEIGHAVALDSLDGIEKLTLSHLGLGVASALSNIDAIRDAAPTLRSFAVGRCVVGDLTALAVQTNLEAITVGSGTLRSLEPLTALPSLRSLALEGAPSDISLSVLGTCRSLEVLRIADFGGTGRLQLGPNGPRIQQLSLDNWPRVRKFEQFGELGYVERLSLAKLQIEELRGVENVLGLETLIVSSCPIRSFEGVPHSVRRVELSAIGGLDLAGLAELPKLESLKLTRVKTLDLKQLSGCVALKRLELGPHNEIRNAHVLSELPSLEQVTAAELRHPLPTSIRIVDPYAWQGHAEILRPLTLGRR